VHTSETTQFREVTCGGSYASGSDLTLLFGIGTQETIQSIKVEWQNDHIQTVNFSNAESPVNDIVHITEKR
jgi:hypothetical protein